MGNLENILEINMAVSSRKTNLSGTLPNLVGSLFKKKDSFSDIDSEKGVKKEIMENSQHVMGKNPLKKEEKIGYDFFEIFEEYISAARNKLYGYYSRIKGAFSGMAGKAGYTDKLLKEFEDWGNVYFKTAFKKLQRLTPLGIMQRYLEELWIYVGKKIK